MTPLFWNYLVLVFDYVFCFSFFFVFFFSFGLKAKNSAKVLVRVKNVLHYGLGCYEYLLLPRSRNTFYLNKVTPRESREGETGRKGFLSLR